VTDIKVNKYLTRSPVEGKRPICLTIINSWMWYLKELNVSTFMRNSFSLLCLLASEYATAIFPVSWNTNLSQVHFLDETPSFSANFCVRTWSELLGRFCIITKWMLNSVGRCFSWEHLILSWTPLAELYCDFLLLFFLENGRTY
jgi:hypothetical protein